MCRVFSSGNNMILRVLYLKICCRVIRTMQYQRLLMLQRCPNWNAVFVLSRWSINTSIQACKIPQKQWSQLCWCQNATISFACSVSPPISKTPLPTLQTKTLAEKISRFSRFQFILQHQYNLANFSDFLRSQTNFRFQNFELNFRHSIVKHCELVNFDNLANFSRFFDTYFRTFFIIWMFPLIIWSFHNCRFLDNFE